MKIRANPPAPYSILNPETNSDSPSAKSNGVRLESITKNIRSIIMTGNNQIIIISFLFTFKKISNEFLKDRNIKINSNNA